MEAKLRSDNRWVKLLKLIPWDEIEKLYSNRFSKKMGAPAKPLRMALGALIIKECCGFSDEETVEQIRENPYLQYFIGLSEYTDNSPFDSSMMVHFRKRLGGAILKGINEITISNDKKKDEPQDSNFVVDNDRSEDNEDKNEGKLILNATCAPSDIRYPTDLSLLNDAREKLEIIIDVLHNPLKGKEKKQRTYREKARKDYLKTAKKRKKTYKEIRKSKGKQLRYISRDLRHIEELLSRNSLFLLSKRQTIPLIKNTGIIPESIAHDSTEEKLFAKVADILLAKGFQELGLSSSVNKERANCADVVATSKIHGYTLVGDAKAFRLSITAKNQKDFKVKSMVDWKGENDYSVLVCPFYQYPKRKSQIYGQALDGNVCLFSWEHFVLFLENDIKESKHINLKDIWNISDTLSANITIKDKDKNTNFHDNGNDLIRELSGIDIKLFTNSFNQCKSSIIERGKDEIVFWKNERCRIEKYSKKKATTELIKAMKMNEKIATIKRYIETLKQGLDNGF